MAETVKKGDFVEIDYTGMIEEGFVFDTTLEAVAKKNRMENHEHAYKPLKICIGKGHVLKGLDNKLDGKEVGKQYTFSLTPEEGFGKKTASYLQLIATSKFTKDNVTPFPGLQVNVDGMMGIVKTVTGGRTIVDFNHPLSGKNLIYEVTIKRLIADDAEKLISLIQLTGLKATSKIENGVAEIITEQEIPAVFQNKFREDLKDSILSLKEVTFAVKPTGQ